MQYKLITSQYASSVSKQVKEYLDDGWRLYGSPSVANAINEYSERLYYIQAIIKGE